MSILSLSGCKFSLTNEHLEYIRELIMSFLLSNPYNFYSILPFFKKLKKSLVSKPFKLPELLYDVVVLAGGGGGVLLAHFEGWLYS